MVAEYHFVSSVDGNFIFIKSLLNVEFSMENILHNKIRGMEYGNVSSLVGHSGIFIRSKMLSSKGIIFFPVKFFSQSLSAIVKSQWI